MTDSLKIVGGSIMIDNTDYSFAYASLSFDATGFISGSLYCIPKSSLHILLNQNLDFSLFEDSYKISGFTLSGRKIIITHVHLTNYGTSFEAQFRSLGSVTTLAKELSDLPNENLVLDRIIVKNFKVHLSKSTVYIEKEGLSGKQVKMSSRKTHMRIVFSADKIVKYFTSVFYLDLTYLDDDQISIEISHSQPHENKIALIIYHKLKKHLINFLSFVNGRKVLVFAEELLHGSNLINIKYPTGGFNSIDGSSFIPIRMPPDPQKHPLVAAFDCFRTFYELSDIYGFDSVIHILNDINNNSTLHQRYYSLIVIIEILKGNHYKHKHSKAAPVITDSNTLQVIDELRTVIDTSIESSSSQETINDLYRLKSIVGSMHRINRNHNSERFRLFFKDLNFDFDNKLNDLIDNLRNSSVHEGNFGHTFESRVNNLEYLDSLVRESILRLIGYKGTRKKIHST